VAGIGATATIGSGRTTTPDAEGRAPVRWPTHGRAFLRGALVAMYHPLGMRRPHPGGAHTRAMPLLFRPRRPLVRGAMLGGTAYLAGRAGARAQQRQYAEQAADADQEARLEQLEAEHAPPPAAGSSAIVEELTKLKSLLDSGVLTQQEFDAAKQRVLAGG
jgi:Short C-terminal domain